VPVLWVPRRQVGSDAGGSAGGRPDGRAFFFIRPRRYRGVDIAEVTTLVGLAASSALVVSVCLLAYNLRASRRDARRNLAFSMMEQLTSSGFAERRWNMRRCIAAAAAAGWKGFDDSLEDFESRAFAYQYELIGQMVEAGTLDYALVRDFLQFSIVADWNAFEPLDARLQERYPGRPSPWTRFRSVAGQVTTDLNGPELRGRSGLSTPKSPPT